MKKAIIALAVLLFSTVSVYADTLTEFLKTSVGKKVIVYMKDKQNMNDNITGTLDKVDDKYIYVVYGPAGDYVIMRDAIASIYVYKK